MAKKVAVVMKLQAKVAPRDWQLFRARALQEGRNAQDKLGDMIRREAAGKRPCTSDEITA